MDIGLLIDGEDRAAAGGGLLRPHRPVHRQAGDTRRGGEHRRRQCSGRSCRRRASGAGRRPAPANAARLLSKAADVMASKVGEFTRLMMEETGATGPWAGFNVMLAANMLREAAAMTTQIAGEVIPSDKPGTLAMAIRQPAGVVLGIAPWNAPVILGTRAVAMPLACGNTVVLKASEMCPGTHRLIGQVLREAGLPNGVVNVVTNDPKDAAADRRGADRASGGEARQLHRLDPGRPDHRRARRPAPQAGAARARRQGAARGARRRRYRRRRQRRGLRRLHAPGPDLHVDRARSSSTKRSPTNSSTSSRARASRAAGRRSARPCRAGLADQQPGGRQRWRR